MKNNGLAVVRLLSVVTLVLMAAWAGPLHAQDGAYQVSESWSVTIRIPAGYPSGPRVLTKHGLQRGKVQITGGAYQLVNTTGVNVGSTSAGFGYDGFQYSLNSQRVAYAFADAGAGFYLVAKISFFVILVPLPSDFGFALFQQDDDYTASGSFAALVGSGTAVDGNGLEFDVSSTATLTAAGSSVVAPRITLQPKSQTVVAGAVVNFNVTASGSSPLSYQWRRNGKNLADTGELNGTASSTLGIAGAQAADAGVYTVVVSNAKGSATSAGATLSVGLPPVITATPASQTVAVGATALFSVTATGTAPLTYVWQKDGTNLANHGRISGATLARLAIHGALPSDAGGYSVTVSNKVGTAFTSPAAALTVQDLTLPTLTISSPKPGQRLKSPSPAWFITGTAKTTSRWLEFSFN